MEKIDQVPDEQNLVDFSRPAEIYSDDNQQKISLINLKDLKDEGIVFDPEIPDIDSWRREEEKRYFTKHTDELQRVLAERQEDGEEGSDEEESGPSEFGNMSKKMKMVTEDGGVLKRVLREGFQTGGLL